MVHSCTCITVDHHECEQPCTSKYMYREVLELVNLFGPAKSRCGCVKSRPHPLCNWECQLCSTHLSMCLPACLIIPVSSLNGQSLMGSFQHCCSCCYYTCTCTVIGLVHAQGTTSICTTCTCTFLCSNYVGSYN